MPAYIYTGTPIELDTISTLKYVEVSADGTISEVVSKTYYDFEPIPFMFTQQPVASGGVITYGTADTLYEDVESASSILAAVTEILARIEDVEVVSTGVATVSEYLQVVDNMVVAAQTQASLLEEYISGTLENIAVTASALASVAEVQMLVNGVSAVCKTSSSLVDVARYVESVGSSLNAGASVTDVLYSLLDVGPRFIIELVSGISTGVQVESEVVKQVDLTSYTEVS